jgi:hypothetical protein
VLRQKAFQQIYALHSSMAQPSFHCRILLCLPPKKQSEPIICELTKYFCLARKPIDRRRTFAYHTISRSRPSSTFPPAQDHQNEEDHIFAQAQSSSPPVVRRYSTTLEYFICHSECILPSANPASSHYATIGAFEISAANDDADRG